MVGIVYWLFGFRNVSSIDVIVSFRYALCHTFMNEVMAMEGTYNNGSKSSTIGTDSKALLFPKRVDLDAYTHMDPKQKTK